LLSSTAKQYVAKASRIASLSSSTDAMNSPPGMMAQNHIMRGALLYGFERRASWSCGET
jgi:hypothetical protein